MINIHQTDHHDTFEELRCLPALLCGCIIISEDSPLKEHIPYNKYIIWTTYDRIIETVTDVLNNYEVYWDNIFKYSNLEQVLNEMNSSCVKNIANAFA